MRHHLNSAFWQEQQFTQCKMNIWSSQVVAVYDVAQNYTTIQQDAIKSSEFGKNQITLHPIPTYYWDNGNLNICSNLVEYLAICYYERSRVISETFRPHSE